MIQCDSNSTLYAAIRMFLPAGIVMAGILGPLVLLSFCGFVIMNPPWLRIPLGAFVLILVILVIASIWTLLATSWQRSGTTDQQGD